MQGRITKQISNQYTVFVGGNYIECTARGKFRNISISPVVGDIVDIDIDNKTIDEIMRRRNKLTRPVVANVDIALIVTSVKKPDLSLFLLDKLVTIVLFNKITPVICLTKMDLLDKKEIKEINRIINYYKKDLGITILDNKNTAKLKRTLKNKLVVLTGQTGAGKSSLLNKLDKELNLETKPISEALNRGVHTTRHTQIYEVGDSYFVDTPGFSSLDLVDMNEIDLKNAFSEFAAYKCSFSDCLHDGELGCLVMQAVKEGKILKSRYENYKKFLEEIHENSSKLYK